MGMARNSANGCPSEGVPTKGRSDRRGARGGGVPVGQDGLLEEPGAGDSSGCGATVVAGAFCPVTQWSPMPHLYSKMEPQKKHTRAVALLILPTCHCKDLLEGCVAFLGHFCSFLFVFSLQLGPTIIIPMSQLLNSLT